MRPRHKFAEHVGEVQMVLAAPDLAALFAEAGRALAEVMLGDVRPVLDGGGESVSIRATDRETLLVAWLDDLISRSEASGRVYTSFVIDRISERELHATICGFAPDHVTTQVKAATMPGLRIEEGPQGLTAAVVLNGVLKG